MLDDDDDGFKIQSLERTPPYTEPNLHNCPMHSRQTRYHAARRGDRKENKASTPMTNSVAAGFRNLRSLLFTY